MEKSILLYSDRSLQANPRGRAVTDMERLNTLFADAGFTVVRTDAAGLAPLLARRTAGIVLVDSAAAFPAAAVEPLKRFCREGGKLITVGGYAFYQIVADAFEPDETRRCISVSAAHPTSAAWELTLTPASEEIGGPMAGILSKVRSFYGFDAGEVMVVKFWMKAEGVKDGCAALHLRYYQGNRLLRDQALTAGGEGWQYVFGRVPTPVGVDRIVLSLGIDGSAGKASFDGLHIGIDHYTRVYDCDFEGDLSRWEQVGDGVFSVEPREKEYYLSSTFADNVEDNALFRRDSIPLFDLEAEIRDASVVVPAPDQLLFGADAVTAGAFSGWSAIAPTGSRATRWQPLLLCQDPAGTVRGYAGALLRCYPESLRGPGRRNTCWQDYPGFGAAFFGITSHDLFENEAMARGLVKTAEVLLGTPYLIRIKNYFDCYRPHETAVVEGQVSDESFAGRLRATLIDDCGNTLETLEMNIAASFSFAFKTTHFADDFYKITCELMDQSGTVLDCMSNGFVVWQQKTIDAGPHLHYHDNLYYIHHGEGTPEKAVFGSGVDDVTGRIRTDLTGPLAMREEFIRRRDLGLCVYEALDNVRGYPKDPEERERFLRTHDAVVALACKYDQLYMLGLAIGDNVACSDEQIEQSARGILETANRYRNNRNLIYYINGDFFCRLNEQTIPVLQPVFNRFLNERYPDDAALAAAWGEPGITRESAVLTGNWPDGSCYADKKAQDYNLFRYYLQNRWIGPLTRAVHSVDPTLPCTSEYYETPKFSVDIPRAINDHDISNIGCFCHFSDFSQRLAYADQRFQNKGFGIGEYGKRGHELYRYTDCEYMRYFPQNEVMDTTVHYLNGAFAMGANHCHLWCYIDLPDGNFPWGIINSDNAPRDLAYWVRNFNFMAHQCEALDLPAEAALILPDNTRSAASRKYQGGHYAAIKALAVLQHVKGRIMTLNECHLVIPESVKVLFYPVAFNPPRQVYDELCRWVERGGVLYVSGDVSGDGDFFGKGASDQLVEGRLESLVSISCIRRNYTGLDYPANRTAYSLNGIRRLGCPYLNARVLDESRTCVVARDTAGNGVIFQAQYGKGQVIFNADPSEAFFCSATIREDKALYRFVLDAAGVPAANLSDDSPADVKVFDLPLRDGGRVVNLAHIAEDAGEITFEKKYVLTQRPLRSQMLRENAAGQLTGVLCEGALKENGVQTLENGAYAYVLSCDHQALTVSRRIAVLPQKRGRVALNNAAVTRLVVGQVEGGKFVPVFSRDIERAEFDVGEHERNYFFLLCEPGDETAFQEEIVRTLTCLVSEETAAE